MRRCWLLLCICTGGWLAAQDSLLTLEEAIRIAEKNNALLAVARWDMRKADQQVREAYGYAMPSVTLDTRYTRALKKPVFFLPDFENPASGKVTPIEIGSNHSIETGFTATQALFNFAVFTGVGTAKVYQRTSRALYRSEYNRMVASVKKVFYQVLLARQVYETTKASLTNAENNFNNVRILNKQGIVSDYDMIRAEVQVENLRPSVISAEQQALVVTNALKVQLGMDAADPLHIRGELTAVPLDSSWLDEQRAVTQNAGLEALRLQQDLNSAVSSIRLAEYMPTLAAFGTYQWQAQKNTMDFGGKDFISTSQVGLTLSLNLFNGFQTTARLAQSRADERKAEQQLRYTRENIRSQMQSIRLRLDEARKRMASQNRTVELAEKSYKIATTRYATGSGTQLEVNDADVALLQARLNRIHAIYDYLVTCVDLEEMISYHQPQN